MRNPTFVVNPKIQIGTSDQKEAQCWHPECRHHEIARDKWALAPFRACQPITRSNGTVARSYLESKEICATRVALTESPEATKYGDRHQPGKPAPSF